MEWCKRDYNIYWECTCRNDWGMRNGVEIVYNLSKENDLSSECSLKVISLGFISVRPSHWSIRLRSGFIEHCRCDWSMTSATRVGISRRFGQWGGGQNLERRNVERPIFRNLKITNDKITKVELFDSFIFEFIFSILMNYLHSSIIFKIEKYWFSKWLN